MAPSFSMLRSSSRRREPVLDARYGDSAISAPNGSISPQYDDSHFPAQHSPAIVEAPVKSSITITIALPWKSKSRSNSLPPTAQRWRPEPVEPSPPLELQSAIESRPPSRSRMVSPPTALSPRLISQTQGSARRSPRPQNLGSLPSRPTPSSTPIIGVLSPVVEGADDRVCYQPSFSPASFKTSSPPPVEVPIMYTAPQYYNQYEPSNTQFEGRHRQTRSIRSRSPGPEYTRRSPPPMYPSRRARSVDPEMQRRKMYESDSSDIDSDCDSLAESGYGSFSSQHRVEPRVPRAKGLYHTVTNDYIHIIRDVEADYRAAMQQKARAKTGSAGSAGSAGSGISADSGYNSGPQELVPSGEDLWG